MGRTCSYEKRKIIMDMKSYVFWFGAFKMISSEMIMSSEPIQQSTVIEQETELIRCKFHFTMPVGVVYYTGDISSHGEQTHVRWYFLPLIVGIWETGSPTLHRECGFPRCQRWWHLFPHSPAILRAVAALATPTLVLLPDYFNSM